MREQGVWILFLVFKGNDLHAGFAPTEDPQAHKEWVESLVRPAWDHAGPENRMGFVIYPSGAATQRSAGMNMTPNIHFGNFGASQPHKKNQLTFATHGEMILGGRDSWANRLGREGAAWLYNFFGQCGLHLSIDPNILLQAVSYKDDKGDSVSLKPWPYHPILDAARIECLQSYYQWYEEECGAMHIHISKHDYRRRAGTGSQAQTQALIFPLNERRSFISHPRTADLAGCMDLPIKRVITRKNVGGRVRIGPVFYVMKIFLSTEPGPFRFGDGR
jgi:hypothetical protein